MPFSLTALKYFLKVKLNRYNNFLKIIDDGKLFIYFSPNHNLRIIAIHEYAVCMYRLNYFRKVFNTNKQ